MTTIATGSEADTVNIRTIGAATTVNAGSEDDTINVGSLAPAILGGTVNGISAPLTINGDAGSDTLNVDDTGDVAGNTGTLTATTLTDLGMSGGITYGTLEHLNIGLGSGGDIFTIASTHTGTTTLNSNAGADTVNVRMIAGATTVNAGSENDTIHVGSLAPAILGGTVDGISAPLTINGNAGSDTLNVDDTGDTDLNTGTLTSTTLTGLDMSAGITYGTLETLNIGLGSGGDDFTIASTHTGTTTLNSNAGGDTVNVQTISGATTVNTGSEDDTINVGSLAPFDHGTVNGISAPLTIDGGDGIDTLNVDDTGDNGLNILIVTANTITGLGMSHGITYFNIENLTFDMGSGDDTINIISTSAATTLNTGAGDDTINVGSLAPTLLGGTVNAINGKLTLDGQDGNDTLNVDDTGDQAPNNGTLTANTLTGLGMTGGGIHYSNLENLEISLGSGNDTFDITGTTTRAGFRTITMVNTGAGNDKVMVSIDAGVDGPLAVNLEAGDDVLDASDSTHDVTVFGGYGIDTIRGGFGNDTIFGDRGVIDYRNGEGVLVTRLGIAPDERSADPDSPLFAPAKKTDGGFNQLRTVANRDVLIGGDDFLWGQRGDDWMAGGAGADEMVGGLGYDAMQGDGGADVMLGGTGEISRAFNPDGSARLNPDGSRHKDVLLTDVAYLTGSIALNGSNMPEGDQATVNALLDADVTLLTGLYQADGGKQYNAWGSPDNRALLLNLIADGDDVISGGGENDAIYGQRGNDTLRGDAGNDFLAGGAGDDYLDGGDGNDLLAGDQAIIDSDWPAVPNVSNGYLVIRSAGSKEAEIGINLGDLGTTIVPMVQVVPGREINAVSQMLPHIFDYGMVPAENNLDRAGGGWFTPFASVVTDWAHHVELLSGNDTITGGGGDDTLVGDDLVSIARTVGFDADSMDKAELYTRRLLDVSDDFSDLIHEQYSLLCGHFAHWNDYWHDHWDTYWDDHCDDAPVIDATFSFGNDNLNGGADNDVLIGDNSTLVAPAFAVPTNLAEDFERFVDGVTDSGDEIAHGVFDLVHLEHHLRDEVVTVNVGWYTHEEIRAHVDGLVTGNDTITAGDGNDLVVGDAFVYRAPSVLLTPEISSGHYSYHDHDDDEDHWNGHEWNDRDWADWSDNHHGGYWYEHDHDWDEGFWHGHGDPYHGLDVIVVGRDVITGGAGSDLVWGDNLALITDNVVRSWGISSWDYNDAKHEAQEALDRISALTDEVGYWFGGNDDHHDDGHHDGHDFWYGWDDRDSHHETQYADDISGGDANDILFGQAGDDRLRGDAGDDWLVGGHNYDNLDGGTGKNKLYSGENNSSSLRDSIAGLMTNWDTQFLSLALPGAPFGNTIVDNGECGSLKNFDFLEFTCPPGLTFQNTETFSDGVANLFTAPQTGIWGIASGRYNAAPTAASPIAMSVMDLGLNSNQSMSLLELSTKVNVQGQGGFLFDYYGPHYFKFVVIDAPADKILIGHYTTQGGWVVDASKSKTIKSGTDYTLEVSLRGNLVTVELNDYEELGYAYDSVAVHGKVGLVVKGGTGAFDNVTVKSNDPAFRDPAEYMVAVAAPVPGAGDTVTLTDAQLAPIVAAAVDAWTRKLGADFERLGALNGLAVSVTDLPDLALGETLAGGRILIDIDGAGHGWFLDASPAESSEFAIRLDRNVLAAALGGGAFGRMDLLTVVTHEIGHLLGFGHDDALKVTVMDDDLEPGVRFLLDELGFDGDPDQPVDDRTLKLLAKRAVEREANWMASFGGDGSKAGLGQNGGGSGGAIDWQTGSTGGWNGGFSSFSGGKVSKAASANFSDFLQKLVAGGKQDAGAGGYDSLGKSLLGSKNVDRVRH